MGEPSSLTGDEKILLRQAAEPGIDTCNINAQNGRLVISRVLKPNELRYFEIKTINRISDDGYDYEKVISQKCVPDENQP